jgi:hypothetical protein
MLGHGHMGCNSCMHPSCKQSAFVNGVCPCACVSGTQVLASTAPTTTSSSCSNADSNTRGGRGRGRAGRGRSGRGGRGGGRETSVPTPTPVTTNTAPITYTCDGLMVLDSNSKPNWKLACNTCNTLLRFKVDIHSISIQPHTTCTTCNKTKIMDIEFNKLKSPLTNGNTSYSGCVNCDKFLKGLVEVVAGRSISINVLRQERHRRRMLAMKKKGGRGRGRGGRGGRGGRKKRDKSSVLMSFEDF